MLFPKLVVRGFSSSCRIFPRLTLTLSLFILCAPASPLTARAQSAIGSADLVISQLYTRGGEPFASYQNDYIEIFNRGAVTVDFNGWGINVTSYENGRGSNVLVRLVSSRSINVEPGRYLLLRLAGGANGQPLPAPDFDFASGPFPLNLGSTGGQIALLRPGGSVPLFGCPTAQTAGVADYLGYGTGESCSEGTPATAPSVATALVRAAAGCSDTEDNFTDFPPLNPNPRNGAAAANVCSAQGGASVVEFESAQLDALESNHQVPVKVTRAGITTGPATVDYAVTGGTASEREDYGYTAGTLRFAPGETSKQIKILLTDDARAEGVETITLALTNPTGGAALGQRTTVTISIGESDTGAPQPNPIDDSNAFVRQHYHDFLNREPDADGLQFWTQAITNCAGDAQCIETRRVNTSAAFYFSIEFRATGFLVHRLYRAAFPPSPARPRGLPRLHEFMRDSQEVGRGVIVSQGDWFDRLEANQRDFVNAFVERPEFLAQYPLTMSPTQFVNALDANAGRPLTEQQRSAFIINLTTGQMTRAYVLRAIAEHPVFSEREANPAFVLMQYYGYLRRNPDDAPDANFDGYDYWLAKLNQFGGDYNAAEMVRAFISSTEYRQRFGAKA